MSCSKCHAENLLDIDTLKPFPGKHSMYHIARVFSQYNPETRQHDLPEVSLDEALEKLRICEPRAEQTGQEEHPERWSQEAKTAYEYLRAYRDAHFPKD